MGRRHTQEGYVPSRAGVMIVFVLRYSKRSASE